MNKGGNVVTNTKTFKIRAEEEFEVTLDMDKYDKETLKQIAEYWGYSDNLEDEDILKEVAMDLHFIYKKEGYHLDEELEGFPMNAQKCIAVDSDVRVTQ